MQVKKKEDTEILYLVVSLFQWGKVITIWWRGDMKLWENCYRLKQTLVTCNLHYKFKIHVQWLYVIVQMPKQTKLFNVCILMMPIFTLSSVGTTTKSCCTMPPSVWCRGVDVWGHSGKVKGSAPEWTIK